MVYCRFVAVLQLLISFLAHFFLKSWQYLRFHVNWANSVYLWGWYDTIESSSMSSWTDRVVILFASLHATLKPDCVVGAFTSRTIKVEVYDWDRDGRWVWLPTIYHFSSIWTYINKYNFKGKNFSVNIHPGHASFPFTKFHLVLLFVPDIFPIRAVVSPPFFLLTVMTSLGISRPATES